MIRALKELKRQMDARAAADEVERDAEGRAIVEMTVLHDDDFLSDFSAGKPVVSGEVAGFLEESAMAFRPKEPICVKIYSDCIDSEEEKVYSNALKEYYVRHYKENRRNMRRNALFSAIMLLIGVVALAVVLTLSLLKRVEILAEVLDIFAWVFLWEAVDLFFLEGSVLRMRQVRCLRFIEAKIEFLPRTKPTEQTE